MIHTNNCSAIPESHNDVFVVENKPNNIKWISYFFIHKPTNRIIRIPYLTGQIMTSVPSNICKKRLHATQSMATDCTLLDRHILLTAHRLDGFHGPLSLGTYPTFLSLARPIATRD